MNIEMDMNIIRRILIKDNFHKVVFKLILKNAFRSKALLYIYMHQNLEVLQGDMVHTV